jgi:putative transposase
MAQSADEILSLKAPTKESSLGTRRPARNAQYTSREFRALLDAHGLVQSLSRPRQCWDNAVAESFFSTLKQELVHRQTFPTRATARRAIFEFIEVFYNRCRLHSTLNYRTPVEYEEERRNPDRGKAQAA